MSKKPSYNKESNIFTKNSVKDPKKLLLNESIDKTITSLVNQTKQTSSTKNENKTNQLMVDIYSKLVTDYK